MSYTRVNHRPTRFVEDSPDDTAAIADALAALGKVGFDTSALQGVPLSALNEILRVCNSLQEDAARNAEEDDSEDMASLSAHYETFAEGFGKLGLTKAQLLSGFKAEKARKPQLSASEFLGGPAPSPAAPSPLARSVTRWAEKTTSRLKSDAETAELDAHYEQFSEQFTKNGLSKDKLRAGYAAEKARKPQLTVNEFLGR